SDHALRLGGDLGAPRPRSPHPALHDAGGPRRAQPDGRAGDARPSRAPERTDARRDQGGPAPLRGVLRRSRGECRVRGCPARAGRRLMRTQVGIVGAGPAGLTLAHLLHLEGIDSVVLENRSREYVEARIRAGVLEQRTVDLLVGAGVGERLLREGIVHHGIELQFGVERHRVPLSELTGGKTIVIYGQTEVVKDLIEARLATGRPLLFEVDDVRLEEVTSTRPRLRFRHEGRPQELECDLIAGCDGFHGVCRPSVPPGVLTAFSREYAYGWLGILAAVAPSSDELVYSSHERGFALLSLRSPSLSRLYLQVRADEDVAEWP